jgi:spoIIIJ-associated protein
VGPIQPSEIGEIAAQFLAQLLKLMGIKARVTYRQGTDLVEPGEAPPLVLDITGGDLGILIGRRSETLQALQDMVRLMVSKELSSWLPIVVDVESYRVRRRQSLRQMAEKMAERVITTHKKIVLEAMPAHERRIIHITLRDHPLVTTKSVGSDDNRKVTIIPK